MDQFREKGDNPQNHLILQNRMILELNRELGLFQNNVSYYVWTDMCRISHRSSKYYPALTWILLDQALLVADDKLWVTLVLRLRQMGGIVKWPPYTQSTPDSNTTSSPLGQLCNALLSPVSRKSISDSTMVLRKSLCEPLLRDCWDSK